MKRVLPCLLPVLATMPLAACGPAGNDPGPGAVTVDEAKALDEAAEMLEQRRLPDEALTAPADDAGENAASPPAAQQRPARQ